MIEDAIRGIFWALAKLMLCVSDWIYDILYAIIDIDLMNSNVIFYTWAFMLCFLSFATLLRIGFVLLHKMADDSESIDVGKLGKKIGSVFLVIALSTTVFSFCLGVPKYVVDVYNKVITYDERLTPSSAVISATAKTPVTSSLDAMASTDEIVSIDTIDEKLNSKEDDKYIYFLGYAELLLCLVGGFVVACVQLNIVVDEILRLFLNIFRFVIGFIPISSLVEDDSTCGDWIRDIFSDTFVLICLPIFTNMVFGLMATSQFANLNGIIRIIVFTIGLMAVYKSAEAVAKYMGASNLSSGGKAGTMLMGLGAAGAMRAAGKVGKMIFGGGRYGMKKGKKAIFGDSKKSKTGDGGSSSGSDDGVTSPVSPISPLSGALGASIQNTMGNSNNYFAGSGSQNSFQSKNAYQDRDDSIIDQSPTSYNGGISDTMISPASEISSNTNAKAATDRSGTTVANTRNDNGVKNVGGRSNMDIGNGKGYRNGLADIKGNKGFVNTSTSGHLYKSSNNIYRRSARDVYGSKQEKGGNQKFYNMEIKGSEA